MSPRKAVVREFLKAMDHRDAAGALACVTDDIEWVEVEAPAPIRGKREFQNNMMPGPEIAERRSWDTRMTEEGDVVVAEVGIRLTKTDGTPIQIRVCDIFEFEGEKIRRLTSFAAVVPALPPATESGRDRGG